MTSKSLRKVAEAKSSGSMPGSVKIWDSFPSINIRDERWNELSPDDRKVVRYRTQWIDEFKEIPFLAHSDKVETQFLAAWERLAAVLEIFWEICNLVWVCRKRFPPCLLKTIHEKHKKCQLHLRTFVPRSVSEAGINHPHDEDLMKSETYTALLSNFLKRACILPISKDENSTSLRLRRFRWLPQPQISSTSTLSQALKEIRKYFHQNP